MHLQDEDVFVNEEQVHRRWFTSKVLEELSQIEQTVARQFDQLVDLKPFGRIHECKDHDECIHILCELFCLNKEHFIDVSYEQAVNWQLLHELVAEHADYRWKQYLQ